MNMTPQQENAVRYRHRTLLVSAGAGSGKTSTLSERILSRISDPDDTEAEIDRFLIVTFTNNSAKDLSEKIEKVLSERVVKEPSNKKAFRQLAKLKYADISTISSFCVGVVKQHFENLGLPAKMRICDPIEADRLLRFTLEELIEEKYAERGESFIKVAELFSGSRSDENMFSVLLSLYKKISAFPEPGAFMQSALSYYREVIEKDEFFDTFYGSLIRSRAVETAKNAVRVLERIAERFAAYPELAGYAAATREDIEQLSSLSELLQSAPYDACRDEALKLEKHKAKAVKVPEELRAIRDKIRDRREKAYKKYVEKLKITVFGGTTEKLKQTAADCEEIESELFSILRVLDARFSEEKRTRGLLDFTDAEKLTYRLFIEKYDEKTDTVYPTEIAKKYRDMFLEIYIDEYQDINRIQDMIFRAICRYDENGHECNRFMVGDVKQSIYRFRNARPELFSHYLDRFTALSENENGDDEHKEYLSNNFRCAENVVKLTNRVFSAVMQKDYGREDNLVYSRREEHKVELPCEILLCAEEKEKEAEEQTDKERDENEEENTVFTEEMRLVACKIRSIVQNPAYVGSNGKPFSFGDITILLRSVNKTAERYARCLESYGIPVYTDMTESFFEQNEIKLCLCLLHAVDNPLRDIYLAGVMRSELFGFCDEDLAVLRRLAPDTAEKDGRLWQSVRAKAERGDDELSEKCTRLYTTLSDYKKASVGIPSDRLILKMFRELKMQNAVSERSFNRYTASAPLRRENLKLLYHYARKFENNSFRGLSAFLDYLAERESDPHGLHSASVSEAADAVKIMSIHASKGLEFPVCILADLAKGFNRNDSREKQILNDTAGIGFKLKDLPGMRSANGNSGTVIYTTPFRDAVAAEEEKCAIEEEKRILYVAMTRAKELLIMTAKMPKESVAESLAADSFMPEDAACFRDWILYSLRKSETLSPLLSSYTTPYAAWNPTEAPDGSVVVSAAKPSDAESVRTEKSVSCDEKRVAQYENRIRERINRSYRFADKAEMLAKISVSELKNGKLKLDERPEAEKEFAVPDFLCGTDETEDPTERGTAIHLFMQHADFQNCEKSVEAEAKRLLTEEFLNGEQFSMLDYAALRAFFESELYEKIKKASVVYREKAFTLLLPLDTVYDMPSAAVSEEDTVLVQGKIDCFFRNQDGSYTITDFKTDRIRNAGVLTERYKRQLYFYRRAVKSMTEAETVRVCLYSFFTGECTEIDDEEFT